MPEPLETLIDRFAPGSRLIAAQPLTGGLSAGITGITVERPDGEREELVLRIQARRSFEFDPAATGRMHHTLLTLSPILPFVPEPVWLDADGDLFGTPCLVMRRLPGKPVCVQDFGSVYAVKAAARLAAIHAAGAAAGDLSFLPEFNRWVEWELEHPPEQPDGPLQEARIRKILASAWPPDAVNRTVLLHGDFWPGNLLWEDDRLTGVIDWEETALGDPLADLAIARLDTLFVFGRDSMDDFTRRYFAAAPGVDPGKLPYWDLYAALRPANELHEWAAGWLDLGRPDITLETMQAGHASFLGEALRQLE